MALRPLPTRWFQVVVAEADAGDALLGLAGLGDVQFEWTGKDAHGNRLAELAAPIARYRELAARYAGYWPEPVFEQRCCTLPIEVSARAALRQIEQWLEAVREPQARIAALRDERSLLQRWEGLLEVLAVQAPGLDLAALAAAGPALAGVCVVLPRDATDLVELVESQIAKQASALILSMTTESRQVWIGLFPAGASSSFCAWAGAQGAACLPMLDWHGGPAAAAAELPGRLAEIDEELASLDVVLRERARRHGLQHAAGTLERIDWVRGIAQNIRCDGRFCWITGWTSEPDVNELERALQAVGVRGTAELSEPPADIAPPAVLRHGPWQRPFEVFARAIGTPGPTEADPTTWVALLVPLLFGYMCGDFGHGAVIVVGGLLLRRRTPLWPVMVVCGAAAMVFGLAYGDVFGFEHLIDPLWVRPLDAPLTILAVPIGLGALVLTLGLLLHTVESCWCGKGRSEGVADAAQLLVYWSLLLALVWPAALWGAGLGVLLCVGNRFWMQPDPLALAAGFGRLLESTFSLLLNTLSFARVGAFALAHAALVLAVMTIADAVPGVLGAALAVVIGNLVVIVLEGLLVSIQASRLVLFEFFLRFFEGKGRSFQPTAAPRVAAGDPKRQA